MNKPVPDFRVRTVESERGWNTEYDYSYFETLTEAKQFFNNNQPEDGRVPEYYFIALHIESFDYQTKEWNQI